jgi:uncharacterized protein YdeI (YjbR/CyaY-like superfamily)
MDKPTRDQVHVFPTTRDFRTWLEANHASAPELWLGFYRRQSGKTAMTYALAIEEALCFGWIDGITYRIDDEVYTVRMTPRRRGSTWSAINIARIAELKAAGRMHPAGLRAFEERDSSKDLPPLGEDSLRQGLPVDLERRLRANPAAWAYWESRPAGYRRQAAYWIQSAKQEATRDRRMAALLEDSAAGRPVKPLRPAEGRLER